MAPREPSRGPEPSRSGDLGETAASRLMLSLASSSMLKPAGHWRDRDRVPSGQGSSEKGGGPEEAAGGGVKLLNRNTGTEFCRVGLER